MIKAQDNGEVPCASPMKNILGIPHDWNDEKKYNWKFCHILAAYFAFVPIVNSMGERHWMVHNLTLFI